MTGTVLIVGAGIAGLRAAAGLLQQGLRVFLLEKESAVGGAMTALERLFPTDEHAACALQAWIPLVAGHRNATLLTSASLLSLEGSAGEFRARVRESQHGSPGASTERDLDVGAVILATGLDEHKGDLRSRFGYGESPNVVTGLEAARQLSGLGPTRGILRRADGEEPDAITWLVVDDDCPVSLPAASAQALGVLEQRPAARVTVLTGTGLRAEGYGDRTVSRAMERDVRYVRTESVEVSETKSRGLTLSYLDDDGSRARLETDMLVLAAPLVPSQATRVLAESLGLEQDDRGFLRKSESGHPILTSRNGVFVCGGAEGPKGIGASVVQACAAASHAASLLASARGIEPSRSRGSAPLPFHPEDPPKIGVVIDVGDPEVEPVLDLTGLAEFTRTLPGVVRVEVTGDASDGSVIRKLLAGGEFNRLVVAGPSPVTHEHVMQRHAEKGGLNRFLVEMVNLHSQCARVHVAEPAEATRKAKSLMKMGIVRARRLEALEEVRVPVAQRCLVVGGTPSGISCVAMLAGMSLKAYLVEREPELEKIPDNDHPLVAPLLARLRSDRNVEIRAPATVGEIRRDLANFAVQIVNDGKVENLEVGAIVLAAGGGAQNESAGASVESFLRLEKGENGFYVGTEGILNPLDLTTAGAFFCGSARAALDLEQAVVDGEGAASRAASVISSQVMLRSPVISRVVDRNCDGCAYCVDPCPTRSITLLEFLHGRDIKKVVEVNEATCIGCGICMATCPKDGILVSHFKPEHFLEMVKAALEDDAANDDRPILVSFCCNRCAYPGADAAGTLGIQYPATVRIIRPVCLGMVHPNIVMEALSQGADGVLLCGCYSGECRSREGIRKALARGESIELLLEDFGLEPERFRLEHIAASEGLKFAEVVAKMTEQLSALGPSPYRSTP